MTEPLPDNQLRAEIGKLMTETVKLADAQAKSATSEAAWVPITAVVAAASFGATLALVLSRLGQG